MQLVDEISPLVAIIIKIFSDITVFVFITVIFLFAFANAFYKIGLNQLEFDKIEVEEFIFEDEIKLKKKMVPLYTTLMGAYKWIYYLSLGTFSHKEFKFGENSNHKTILGFLFVIATFTIVVHMMSMLIAIMGDTFTQNQQVEEQLLLKGKLKFIIDNWYLNALGDDKQRIKFIITALMSENEDDAVEIANRLQNEINHFKKQQKVCHDNLRSEINSIHML